MAQRSYETPSPSTSSGFLPLGRYESRSSLTSTQTERENMNAALDQIHTAAYQSDSLTLFNEFTTPLHQHRDHHLHQMTNDCRKTSRGSQWTVQSFQDLDKAAAETPAGKSSTFDRSISKSASDLTGGSVDYPLSNPISSQGSRLHSPVVTSFQHGHESIPPSSTTKSSRISSKSASISSRNSIPPSPGPKASIGSMTKSTSSSNATDLVIAANQPQLASSSSVNFSAHGSKNPDSFSIASRDGRDGPVDAPISRSSSVLSRDLPHSPILPIKTQELFHDDPDALDGSIHFTPTSQVSDHQLRSSVSGSQQKLSDKASMALMGAKHTDSTQDLASQSQENMLHSRTSFGNAEPATPKSASNNQLKIPPHEGVPYRASSVTDSMASVPREETRAVEPATASISSKSSEKLSLLSGRIRFPGHTMSRASTAETTTTVSSLPPLNTGVDRLTVPSSWGSRQSAPSDGMFGNLRNKLLSRDFWMRDENAKDCFHCRLPFTTFRRKHHCRTCGHIFDSKCTLLIPGNRFGQAGTIRVCKPCETMINAHEDDSSELSDSEQSPIVINPRVSEISWAASTRPSADEDDSSSVISQSIDHVLKTPTMAIPATRRAGEGHNRRSAILEINSDRPLTRPTSSRSLRSSLASRPHTISHKRHHSRQQYIRSFKPYHEDRAPFQRRHVDDLTFESRLPAFHKDNIIDPDLAQYLSDDGSSGDEQPSIMSVASEGQLSKSGDQDRALFGGFLAAMKKGRSAFGDRGISLINQPVRDTDDVSVSSLKAVNLPRSSRRRNMSVASSVHRQSPKTSKSDIVPYDPTLGNVSHPVNLGQTGFKMTRSSSMKGTGAPPVELNKTSLEHMRSILRQLLAESSVPRADSWETALMPILLKAADEVDPDVQRGDDMDIRHYVKLKKIPGGRPSDTSYVSGLVFTKNLALKSMPRSIFRPNILILTFPLEYARQQQHFMSLEPVLRQEREFLENLVTRIASLHPNLLLVQNNVSGLALDLLEKVGIATAYNVKPSVLEAVSRCTQTRIMTSMDKLLMNDVHSVCNSFDVKTYVHKGRKKTYMYISGCPKELGCTIVLRGGDEKALGKVKEITEFMIYVVYNLRLETCVMRDEFAKLEDAPKSVVSDRQKKRGLIQPAESLLLEAAVSQTSTAEALVENSNKKAATMKFTIEVPDDVPMPKYYSGMVQDHETKILSASPSVKFEPPYLLMRTREMERRLTYLQQLREQDKYSEESADEKATSHSFALITPEMIHEPPLDAPPKAKEVMRAAYDAEYDRVLYHYQTQKRQWETYASGEANMFDPYAHQNIVVLYSLVCTETSVPCTGPDIFALEFYNEHGDDTIFEPDCTIGQYVEDLCHTANAACSVNGCERRMFEHHRQYVHGEAQLSVMTQPYPAKIRGLQDTVLMWSICKKCGHETQVTQMSQNTWKYSFGKYLEVSFWGRNLHARAGVCPHDLQRDHLRYFGYKDVAIRVQYDPINLLEIIVPRPRVTWKVDNDLRMKNEVFLHCKQRIDKFLNSVLARLKAINVQSVVPELLDECKKEIENLVQKAHEDMTTWVQQLQDGYNNSGYWEVIPLNKVLRIVQENVVEWDIIFAAFENSFFPSEKDIKRMATLQLKKIFLDKDATSMTTEDSLHAPADVEDEEDNQRNMPRTTRRMTLSPEKTQDVLVSVVQEHAGKNYQETPQQNLVEEGQSPPFSEPTEEENLGIDAVNGKACSPQSELVSQKEVQHLDLAVPSSQLEQGPLDSMTALDQSRSQFGGAPLPAESQISKALAELSSLPSEQCIKSMEDGSTPSTPPRRSAIPRLAEGAFRRAAGKGRSPSLQRSQTQPSQLLREKSFGIKLTPTNSNDSEASRGESTKTAEKKLTDRLGLSALKNGRFTTSQSLIPRASSAPKRHQLRVSSLAKHFEQLSREFDKERQRERDQRAARGTQSRAFPLASSKPIVEVYRNVREAVEEREPPADGEESPISLRFPLDNSSRKSDEFTNSITKENLAPNPTSEENPHETEGSHRTDPQLMSEGEQDENLSDEERNTAEDLHPVDSHEETKLPEDDSIDFKDLPKHERTTLLKMLTNFWSERSASGWENLDYPLSVMDHVFADSDIIVREDEPSTLVAFALDSPDYKGKLASIQNQFNDMEKTGIEPGDGHEPTMEAPVEKALKRPTGTHLKYQFEEGPAKMLCKVFYAEQFDALRKKCGVADRIVESLSRCAKWDSKGGKTKSLFLKTLDDRFILKSLSTIETQAFLKFAPSYFLIMAEALFHELPSAIAKMFGFYQVIIKNPVTGTEFNWYLLLMENLFYDRVPERIFDLKGSMRNRKVESTGERDEVLLDENMVDFIYETPLFSREHSKKLLSQSVWNDTLFLGRQDVMDYSLMIAIDEQRSELVVGIIDCIRTYTWDKKLESWIKDRGFAGGGRNRPTVTSPKEYKGRFREAMARYVLQAPSCWHQFQPRTMYQYPQNEAHVGPSRFTDIDTYDRGGATSSTEFGDFQA
ncbi:hypothetical protein N7495_008345 [Penicillium taxi]|uniref:uncharacterized protein n=1 Tax=Penicillium taxi TaxID=168475 RepID=UPI0025454320|nr:uncharacterized protein N7495_008345 [Penicillium taxi]KAJ5888304.1 hypothetical protein N7495_008345 [Penicillium taxi]